MTTYEQAMEAAERVALISGEPAFVYKNTKVGHYEWDTVGPVRYPLPGNEVFIGEVRRPKRGAQ